MNSLNRFKKKSGSPRDFRDLEAYQRAVIVRQDIWSFCKTLPTDEKYRLADQMIRASRSATACIAEGYGRYHYQETIHFCRQARGSLYELLDHIVTALECKYIVEEQAEALLEKVRTTIKILNGYIGYLRKRKENNA
jgi:four helix bundle protein